VARSVFTSFHYQRDIFRVNVVRNSYLCKGGYNVAGYWDHSLWEATKSRGEDALKKLIQSGLDGTTVTAVLAGAETASRYWVQYELIESWRAEERHSLHIRQRDPDRRISRCPGPQSAGQRLVE